MESANKMEHTMRHLQISGVSVPAIGIGTWHMGCSPARFDAECDALRAGIDAGARVIDTAEMYGSGASESMVGTAIKGLDRSELFIITKVLPNNASRKQMEHSLDASLARLGTDYADLYLLHWRGEVPLEQTVEEMQRLWHSGKIKSWGVSNFDLADMEELAALPHGNHVAANEDLYNLSSRGIEFELIGWQRSLDIPLIAYSPLGASGGERGAQEMRASPAVNKVAETHGVTPSQVLLAWVIRNGHTLAIPQTSNEDHMRDNIAAANLTLTDDDLTLLDQAFPPPRHKMPLDIL
ncbi:aldo/keto reductase [Propionibacterium freudenreichii]|uniref:aldo/keto reductase n=2 Tax=Propionibacterium freudenreichii TaxID=1744 RepID=UPI0024340ED2|nr:aldo/keto reductase [Propionibacterium freudenreichii]